MNAYGGSRGMLHALLSSKLHGGDCGQSPQRRLLLRERYKPTWRSLNATRNAWCFQSVSSSSSRTVSHQYQSSIPLTVNTTPAPRQTPPPYPVGIISRSAICAWIASYPTRERAHGAHCTWYRAGLTAGLGVPEKKISYFLTVRFTVNLPRVFLKPQFNTHPNECYIFLLLQISWFTDSVFSKHLFFPPYILPN